MSDLQLTYVIKLSNDEIRLVNLGLRNILSNQNDKDNAIRLSLSISKDIQDQINIINEELKKTEEKTIISKPIRTIERLSEALKHTP